MTPTTPTTDTTLAQRLEMVNATIDATIELVAPARGRVLRARGRVVDAGKLLTVCAAEVYAVSENGDERLCATLLATARNIDTNAPRAT